MQKSKLTIDDLKFDKEELIVMEGSALLSSPLREIMSQHYITRSTFTAVVKELDLA